MYEFWWIESLVWCYDFDVFVLLFLFASLQVSIGNQSLNFCYCVWKQIVQSLTIKLLFMLVNLWRFEVLFSDCRWRQRQLLDCKWRQSSQVWCLLGGCLHLNHQFRFWNWKTLPNINLQALGVSPPFSPSLWVAHLLLWIQIHLSQGLWPEIVTREVLQVCPLIWEVRISPYLCFLF